jgi:hypothetical protein
MSEADLAVFSTNVVACLRSRFVEAGKSDESSKVPRENLIAIVNEALQQEKQCLETEFPDDVFEANAKFRIFREAVCAMLPNYTTFSVELSFADVRNGLCMSLGRMWFLVYGFSQ